jgi:hypothetical protein
VYDIVGDIHGHAEKLVRLLNSLGYKQRNGIWSHPDRKLVSVGDLIDRGPHQREVIDILRPMTEQRSAIVLMGNHEFNAVSWYLKNGDGKHLREHSDKNYAQHRAFLEQAIHDEYWYKRTLDWFQSLPLLFETSEFCCVHAAWDHQNINYLKASLTESFTLHPHQWEQANNQNDKLFLAIEYCLKGPEVDLPSKSSFTDGNGNSRSRIRVKWWNTAATATYRSSAISVPNIEELPDTPLPSDLFSLSDFRKLIFFGHYWMTGEPKLLNDRIACLDWSVVKTEGKLAAYRYNGESQLHQDNLVWV